jgi:hypothetical protein
MISLFNAAIVAKMRTDALDAANSRQRASLSTANKF